MKSIEDCLREYLSPRRVAISTRFPILKPVVLLVRQNFERLKNYFNPLISHNKSIDFFECVVARHQSVLRRKLGDSDPFLQEQKIKNLTQAIARINGVILEPNQIFSYWELIGRPTAKKGYVDGMLLSGGKVVPGIGGGLCQLSNLLYWLFLHAPTKTINRFHHSLDVFPDSGRVLPFGGGATVVYNFVDLKMKNISNGPLQLKIWLTDKHLKAQLVSTDRVDEKFHLYEKNHCFVKYKNHFFRYNELYRETKIKGMINKTELVTQNFAPVLYKITDEYLTKNDYRLVEIKENFKV